MILVLIGPPGSGKSTQSMLLVDSFGIPFISAGEIIRKALNSEPFLGYKKKVEEGNLLSNEIVIEIIQSRFNELDLNKGFIVEGFPRTLGQAQWMDNFLSNKGFSVDKVFYLDINGIEALKNRILARHQCSSCGKIFSSHDIQVKGVCPMCSGQLYGRQDDNELVLENRINQFKQQTLPVKDYYSQREVLVTVDAGKEICEVFTLIKDQLNVGFEKKEEHMCYDCNKK
jgi:adenylate kinase